MVQAKPQQPQIIFSARRYRWTRAGRFRLGKVIQASLEHNRRLNEARGVKQGEPNWKPDRIRRLAVHCGFANHVSLGNIIRGSIANQTKEGEEILRAIAPYCYRLIRFDIEQKEVVRVVLDYTQTYEGGWEDLAAIGEKGEDYDSEVITPAKLSLDMAAELLEHLQSSYKFIPVLEELLSHGKKEVRSARQVKIMTEEDGIQAISRSFRAAVSAQGLETPERLEPNSAELAAISRLLKLEPASVIALYNSDRLPSVYEVEALIDGGYLSNDDGEPYTLQELLDIIDPQSSGNGRAHHRKARHQA